MQESLQLTWFETLTSADEDNCWCAKILWKLKFYSKHHKMFSFTPVLWWASLYVVVTYWSQQLVYWSESVSLRLVVERWWIASVSLNWKSLKSIFPAQGTLDWNMSTVIKLTPRPFILKLQEQLFKYMIHSWVVIIPVWRYTREAMIFSCHF